MPSSSHSQPRNALDVVNDAQLHEFAQRLKQSGILGRSRIYAALLDYLVACCIEGRQPKEIEIAIEVLGRPADFDVTQDASVRVHIHQLRKKLDRYYSELAPDSACRLVIPKGQYMLAAVNAEPASDSATDQDQPPPRPSARRLTVNRALLVLALVLLGGNLVYLLNSPERGSVLPAGALAAHPLWSSLMDDELPILLVTGDYFIFGELNDTGNVTRMIREFDINSSRDLENRIFSDISNRGNYRDLDLSYIPEGSAYALLRIAPLLQQSGKTVNITMMSDLSTHDMRSNHIVYIGYISALDKLAAMTFAASGLQVGRSYDELLDLDSGQYYTSDAGLPEAGQQFHDYGLVSTYAASPENQVVIVAGMRDAGLMHTALAVSDAQMLDKLSRSAGLDASLGTVSFEALYEVYGVDRMNFSANLVYTRLLDSQAIWGRNLTSFRE